MAKTDGIPAPAVRRLSLYLRQLEAFRTSNLQTVSSKQLGQAVQTTDAQVRKDLAYFGQFGQPGIGYGVDELIQRLRSILGTDRTQSVALIGAGNLGRALAAYRGFESKGFALTAVFDVDPSKVGRTLVFDQPLVVRSMDQLQATVTEHDIRLAVLAVPAPDAQKVAERLIDVGIRGILNFAPISLKVPPGVTVSSVDLAVHLEQLSFRLSDR